MVNWEIGSEFHWTDTWLAQLGKQYHGLPDRYALFSNATVALLQLAQVLPSKSSSRQRLHLPCFFCMEVPLRLQEVYDLVWYRDLPTQPLPDFNSLRPQAGEVVLVLNTFGIRTAQPWQNWMSQHPEVIVVEDHSHDPFSDWAQQSKADYVVASLRKTLPIPDGGIVWSPKHLGLPISPPARSKGANQRVVAMLLKQAYLTGLSIDKSHYRQLEQDSFEQINHPKQISVSDFTAAILPQLDIPRFRHQRSKNIQHFLDLSQIYVNTSWEPLFWQFSKDSIPFNSVILCRNQTIRDRLREYLICSHIYPAIHWQHSSIMSSGDPLAIDLSQRILTIPTDQRYSEEDIDKIVDKINFFMKSIK